LRPRLKFLVIGGGISGLFLSFYLLQTGNDVVLADVRKGSVRTSAYNAGQLSTRPSFTDIFTPSEVVRISPREKRLNRGWFALARRQSRQRYEVLASSLAKQSLVLYGEFFARETAMVDLTGEVLELHSKLRSDDSPAAGARFLGPRELAEVGYKGFEGGWMMEERSLHSRKLLDHLRSRISEMGGRVFEGDVRLKRLGSRIARAVVRGDEIAAEAYVVAAGSWSREVCEPLRYDPMVIPARGLVLFYRTGGERLLEYPAHYEDEGVTATQHDADTVRLTSFFELVGFNPRFSRARTDWLFDTATSHFSRRAKLAPGEVGVGYRPSTPDQLPVVGRIPGCENGYILTGSTRKGMALAPVLSQLLMGLMLGTSGDVPLLRAMDPARFVRGPSPVPRF
jgi:glycine/D-amino acid oxidase-like deaminating enzyme